MIRITPIRVIGADGEQVGVIETAQALKMAESAGMDLVEISPEARPPVCKIMDYGKFKYEQSKSSKSKSAGKASELKEVRLGRSVKIDPHDVQIRVNQSRRFLVDGHKVVITQKFRGREMAHRELGINRLREIAEQLADVSKLESPPRWNGPQASITLAPDKPKIEAFKRAEAKKKAAEAAQASRLAAEASRMNAEGAAGARAAAPQAPAADSLPATPTTAAPATTGPTPGMDGAAGQAAGAAARGAAAGAS